MVNELIQELNRRFFVLITLAYIAGIITGRIWVERPVEAYWPVAFILAVLAAAYCFKLISLYRVALLLVVIICGAAAFYYAFQQPADSIINYSGSPVYIEGTVVEEPLFLDDHAAYRVRVESVKTAEGLLSAQGDLLVRIYGRDDQAYRFGEKLRLRGIVVEPRGQRNPGGFDYRFHLQSQGVEAVMSPNKAQVSSLGTGEINLLTASAVKLRSAMAVNIKNALPSPTADLLTAVLFGRHHPLPDMVEENFRRAGAGHLMAVSGLHVGLVAALILGFWRRLGLQGRLPLVLAVVLVLAYAYLTGMRPSALRAAVMVSMALGAVLLDRRRDLPTAVAFAALITIFINPMLLFTVGFQLSYAATLLIVYAYRPLVRILDSIKCPRFLQAPLAVTIAAQLGVLPLCVYYFQHLPTGAIIFNLLLLPLLAFVIGLGLAGAFFSLFFYPAGEILLWASRPLLEIMLFITGLSRFPAFYISLRPPGWPLLMFFYGLMALALFIYYSWEKQTKKEKQLNFIGYARSNLFKTLHSSRLRPALLVGLFLFVALVVIWSGILLPSEPVLTVTFVDVGQGAAALIEAPCGAVIMIDAGGELPFRGEPGDIGERVILPFFRYQGIDRIDLAVVTHPHEDHFGGFTALVGVIDITKMLVSPVADGPLSYYEMLEQAEMSGTVIKSARAGQAWYCDGGLSLRVLAPPKDLLWGTGSDLNNNSIVIMLNYGETRMLFTGDIEDAAAEDLFKRQVDLGADLLLVPHHGGYMEAMPYFLEAVGPAIAVIQVGVNPFGHPHPYVIEALEEAGVTVCRNDDHGAVIVETDGLEIWVSLTEQQVEVAR